MKTKKRNWIPVYLVGRDCFQKPVLEALDRSDLPFMPGYLFDNSLSGDYGMLWVDEQVNLREYKKAIGGKLIWKHRIRFFTDLNEFTSNSKAPVNTPEEFDTAA
ncbi:MAG: hypothetical protein HRU69_12505 [Flammeovirgaceae bacterium]|nr:MAG: hypothetical protein HRU69_12505 [Flammeovirgaceae bacterium]